MHKLYVCCILLPDTRTAPHNHSKAQTERRHNHSV
jgi:hypothetical protein